MTYGERFEEAFGYATRVHRAQKRKGTNVPYITHLMAVAAIVGENGGTEDEVIAALLHDAPEDHGGIERLEDIREKFGDRVAEIVAGCTDTYEEDKPEWWGRKKAYIAHLADAPEPVRLVSAADKLHNARAILADLRVLGDGLWRRFKGGKDGTLWYYREFVKTFRASGADAVVEELDRVVGEIEDLAGQKQGRLEPSQGPAAVRAGSVERSGFEPAGSESPSPSGEGWQIFFDAYDTDAHAKFIKWIERHQSGYVISRRSPYDAMLHRAYCGHFKHGDESASLTRTMKVCSQSKGELEAWARENIRSRLKRCRSCM